MPERNRFPMPKKSAGREHGNSTRFIPNNLPALDERAKDEICRKWGYGTPIRQIAMQERLTVPQAEAVVWERYAWLPTEPITPSVRDSRRLHVVAIRRAA